MKSGVSRFPTVHQQLVDALRELVVTGEFPPGARLRQMDLAERFGISSIPIREALRALEQDGLVSSVPRRGWVVNHLSPEEVEEIYELRALLEEKALKDAMPHLDETRLDELRRLTKIIVSEDEAARNVEAREEFYKKLYEASGRQRLVSLVLALHGQLTPYLRQRRVEHSNEAHLELMDALERRDVDAAARVISTHLAQIRAACVEAVSTWGVQAPGGGHPMKRQEDEQRQEA